MNRAVATVVAALVVGAFSPVASSASEPTRVLIVGDSVTHGYDGDYTWRYFAWKGLEQTGASVDFVGRYAGTATSDQMWGGSYADPNFDTDHSARWGQAMVEPWYWPSTQAPLIGDLVAESQPDVVVEQLGINDLAWVGLSAEQMLDSVRRFVSEGRAAKPDVDFVLGSVPQTWVREVEAYNAALPDLAVELSTADSRVTATPVADFVEGVDTYDPAHPNSLGERKIARSVSVGLEALGVGRGILMPAPAIPGPHDPVVAPDPEPEPQPEPDPEPVTLLEVIALPEALQIPEPPSIAPSPGSAVPPAAPRRVRAVRAARKTVVSWRPSATAESYVVKCGARRAVTTTTRDTLRTSARSCKVRAVSESGVSEWAAAKVKRR